MNHTTYFGYFVRSKCFAFFFFILLFAANWFVYAEICAVFRFAELTAPDWRLLFGLLGVLVLYEITRHFKSGSSVRKWILYIGGLYVSFFLYWVMSLLLFQLLALFLEGVTQNNSWDMIGFFLATGCALVVLLYGIVHAHTVIPVQYTVALEDGTQTCRIVLLSDVHLGIYNGAKHLEKVVALVNAAQPDLVVIAGDLFDGAQAGAFFDQAAAAAQFRRIQARDGVVFVTGNHDPAATDPNFRAFLRAANISLLNDSGLLLDRLVIFGRNDAISAREPDRRRLLQMIASGYQRSHPIIVVDHNPQGADEAVAYGADLVLCGHTHRGQMFPVTLFTKWAYGKERFWGHHQLGKTHVVVSAGCGVFQLPVRIGTDNEVVSIEFHY